MGTGWSASAIVLLGSGAGSSANDGDFFEVAEVMGDFKSETHFTLAAGRRGRSGVVASKGQTDGAGSQIYLGARRWKTFVLVLLKGRWWRGSFRGSWKGLDGRRRDGDARTILTKKHWRGLQAENAWKGAPDGDL